MTFATLLVAFGSRSKPAFCSTSLANSAPRSCCLWIVIRWLIATLTSIAVIALIYHHAVPRTQPWHSVIPGATLATAMWFSSTLLLAGICSTMPITA